MWAPLVHPDVFRLAFANFEGMFRKSKTPAKFFFRVHDLRLLDAVFGAFRSVLDGLFNDRIFVISFLSNVLVAAVIVFLGDQLGVGSQMSTGVVVVLTMRIFANVAAIRRHLLKA